MVGTGSKSLSTSATNPVVVGSEDGGMTEVVGIGRSVVTICVRSLSLTDCEAADSEDVIVTEVVVVGTSMATVCIRSPSLGD